ncbi:MAG: hypothetical protein FWB73_00225 [Treponema sp.]|nr:hypothetical protein [Treponema sp.]
MIKMYGIFAKPIGRFYCESCKTEFNFKDDNTIHWDDGEYCPICGNDDLDKLLIELPDFETPSQYEKRTGKKWNGAVWVKFKSEGWRPASVRGNWYDVPVVCAASPEPPPDDYVPEEEA